MRPYKYDCNPNLEILDVVLDDIANKLLPNFQLSDLEEFLHTKKGKLRGRYLGAVNGVLSKGYLDTTNNINKSDCGVSMFLKTEKYNQLDKDPRMICGRDPKFNLIYQRWTVGLEHAFMALPEVMKGRNPLQRGQYFARCMRKHKYLLKTDYKRFDATQSIRLLYLIEVGLAKRLLSLAEFELFFKAWAIKIRKFGRYPSGLSFSFIGCRGSGDMDTGLFNTLVNLVAAKYFLVYNQIPGDIMADGDDGGIGIDTLDYQLTFQQFGLDIELEAVTDYHEFRFCSSVFVEYNRQGDMIQLQDIPKLLNNIGVVTSKKFHHCVGEYYYSLGYMYQRMYPNFPIFNELSQLLMRIGNRRYFHKTILEEVNPSLAIGCEVPIFESDPSVLLVEYMLTFNYGSAMVTLIQQDLASLRVEVPANMDKRYRVASTPPITIQSCDIRLAEEILIDSIKRSKAPGYVSVFPERLLY